MIRDAYYTRMKHDLRTPVLLASKAMGSQKNLGALFDLTQEAISQWSKIPAEKVLEIAEATDIPKEQLRPDLYPVD